TPGTRSAWPGCCILTRSLRSRSRAASRRLPATWSEPARPAAGDLARARHRVWKLLLRHGIVYYDGHAWTRRHDTWLRHDAIAQLSARATRLAFDSDYENVLAVKARRDRLDVAIGEIAAASEFTPLVH